MNAFAKEKEETQLEVLDRIQHAAPFKSFNPMGFAGYSTRLTHPLKFLNSIGMEWICNLLLNQHSPKDIAKAIGVSQHIIMRWIDASPDRQKDWEWALAHEADNLMFAAQEKLEAAFVPADKALDKAEKVANHKRVMAKGFGPKRWGQRQDALGLPPGASVTYNFNVALLPGQQERLIREKERVLEVKREENPPVEFSLDAYLGSGSGLIDIGLGLKRKEELTYEEAAAQETIGKREIREEETS